MGRRRGRFPPLVARGWIEAEAALARIEELEAEVERRGRLIAEASDSEWPDSCLWCHETSRHAETCRAFNHNGSVRWGDPEGE